MPRSTNSRQPLSDSSRLDFPGSHKELDVLQPFSPFQIPEFLHSKGSFFHFSPYLPLSGAAVPPPFIFPFNSSCPQVISSEASNSPCQPLIANSELIRSQQGPILLFPSRTPPNDDVPSPTRPFLDSLGTDA